MLASLAHALEVRFDLAFELQSIAPRADGEGILDDIAAQLSGHNVSLALQLVLSSRSVESHAILLFLSSLFQVTHFLLSAFIASSLHARLSASLCLFFIFLSAAARTALEFNAASLSLVATSRTWTHARSWAGCPTTRASSLTPFHAEKKMERKDSKCLLAEDCFCRRQTLLEAPAG